MNFDENLVLRIFLWVTWLIISCFNVCEMISLKSIALFVLMGRKMSSQSTNVGIIKDMSMTFSSFVLSKNKRNKSVFLIWKYFLLMKIRFVINNLDFSIENKLIIEVIDLLYVLFMHIYASMLLICLKYMFMTLLFFPIVNKWIYFCMVTFLCFNVVQGYKWNSNNSSYIFVIFERVS